MSIPKHFTTEGKHGGIQGGNSFEPALKRLQMQSYYQSSSHPEHPRDLPNRLPKN